MARLIKTIKKERVAAVITELQYSDKTAGPWPGKPGRQFFRLESVATGPPVADTYERAMKANLEAMKRIFR